jgi:hypothetical protein
LKVGVSRGQEWTSEERELVNTLWGWDLPAVLWRLLERK